MRREPVFHGQRRDGSFASAACAEVTCSIGAFNAIVVVVLRPVHGNFSLNQDGEEGTSRRNLPPRT